MSEFTIHTGNEGLAKGDYGLPIIHDPAISTSKWRVYYGDYPVGSLHSILPPVHLAAPTTLADMKQALKTARIMQEAGGPPMQTSLL